MSVGEGVAEKTFKGSGESITCIHCGLEVPEARVAPSGPSFCCNGCHSVYCILQELGLEDFYSIRDRTEGTLATPPTPGAEQYIYFDDPSFVQEHCRKQGDLLFVRFSVAGLHCAACVWVLEKLPEYMPGVVDARISLDDSMLVIAYDPARVPLSRIAQRIDSLGYRVRASNTDEALEQRAAERRTLLMQIAVAAVCAGNVMMVAVSLYQGWFTGIEDRYRMYFETVSALATLPVVLYSAQPFYMAAIAGLRMRTLHIDFPISLGILAGYLLSIANSILGTGHVYYDSVCMLVFLLLLGRWSQRSGLDRIAAQGSLLQSITSGATLRRNSLGEWEEVYAASLRKDDCVRVVSGSTLVADGRLLSEFALLDNSLLTGESQSVRVKRGSDVFAGTKNLGPTFEMSVVAAHSESRLGKFVEEIELRQKSKPAISLLTDSISVYFVGVVLSVSLACALYWYSVESLEVAFERTLAVLIVSCPCALGLAAPVSFSVALRRLAQQGVYVSCASVLERLSAITTVFLDKTGTVTQGQAVVTAFRLFDDNIPLENVQHVVGNLERNSQHPLALALREWATVQSLDTELRIQEFPGRGVEARGRSTAYRIGSLSWASEPATGEVEGLNAFLREPEVCGASVVLLSRERQPLAAFAIRDDLKPDAIAVVGALQQRFDEVHLLSGDRKAVVEQIAAHLDIPPRNQHHSISPEEKLEIIEQAEHYSPCVMVGDGANDAGALRAASVGIALRGGAELSMKVADIYVHASDLGTVVDVYDIARKTMATIRRNLFLSIAYNLVGTAAAVSGYVGPLTAAVLMPLSSATVVLSSLALSRKRLK